MSNDPEIPPAPAPTPASNPSTPAPRAPRKRSPRTSTAKPQVSTDSTFGQIVGILACILAGLQLVPAYSVPKTLWLVFILGAFAVGAIVFAVIKIRRPGSSPERRRFLLMLILLLVLTGASGWHIYSLQTDHAKKTAELKGEIETLQSQSNALAAQLRRETGSDDLRAYLAAVVKEGDERWDGEFESRYARPTLYLLNREGTREQSPIQMQEQLMLWRTGNAGIGPEFRGVAGLALGDVSFSAMAAQSGQGHDAKAVAKGMVNYVDRPLADSDLLNKPGRRVEDNIPERVLVLADPAAGKTTLLERLDLIQARRARGSSSEAIPVRISLNNLEAPTKESIVNRLRERLGKAADEAFKDRTLLVMLDALDEAPDPVAASRAIAAFTKDYQAILARVIVTARLRNYDHVLHRHDVALWKSDFLTAILYGLDQISIEKQILTRSPLEVRKRLFEQLAESRSRSAWLQFLRLPMNYELMKEVLLESGSELLPQGQAQLIEKFIDRRFKQKGIDSSDAEHCKVLLTTVAANRLANGIAKRSSGDFGLDAFVPGGKEDAAFPHTRRVEQLVSSGLIVERKPGRFRFFHQNILDYFIARGLTDLNVIAPESIDWREIILFRCGMGQGKEVVEHLEKSRASGVKVDDELLKEARLIARYSESESTQR